MQHYIFVVFSNSPEASEKVNLMLFLWSARLVKIYSLTTSIKTYNFWHFSMFHKLQEHPSELYNLHFLHQHQNLYIFIWPILIQINSFLTPFHFCGIPAWCKSTQIPVLTKLRAFQSSKAYSKRFEKANFAHFVSFPLGANLLIYFFWQNWGLLKALEL